MGSIQSNDGWKGPGAKDEERVNYWIEHENWKEHEDENELLSKSERQK